MVIKKENYKGFHIRYEKIPKGFNQYDVEITKYRFKGTRREEYYMKKIYTYSPYILDARKMAKKHINNIGKIKWHSQGLSRAMYLPA